MSSQSVWGVQSGSAQSSGKKPSPSPSMQEQTQTSSNSQLVGVAAVLQSSESAQSVAETQADQSPSPPSQAAALPEQRRSRVREVTSSPQSLPKPQAVSLSASGSQTVVASSKKQPSQQAPALHSQGWQDQFDGAPESSHHSPLPQWLSSWHSTVCSPLDSANQPQAHQPLVLSRHE